MGRKRRNFSKEFKAKVALEALRKREILQELAKKHDLYPNQIVSLKKSIQGELPERSLNDESLKGFEDGLPYSTALKKRLIF